MTSRTKSEAKFYPGKYYGRVSDSGKNFYFVVRRGVGSIDDIWTELSGYVNAETFDAFAERFDLPKLGTIQQRDRSDDAMIKRVMERFQQALSRVRDGTYKTPEWIAEHARDLDAHFEPSGHVFVPHILDDRCAVCAQVKDGHKSDDEVSR